MRTPWTTTFEIFCNWRTFVFLCCRDPLDFWKYRVVQNGKDRFNELKELHLKCFIDEFNLLLTLNRIWWIKVTSKTTLRDRDPETCLCRSAIGRFSVKWIRTACYVLMIEISHALFKQTQTCTVTSNRITNKLRHTKSLRLTVWTPILLENKRSNIRLEEFDIQTQKSNMHFQLDLSLRIPFKLFQAWIQCFPLLFIDSIAR